MKEPTVQEEFNRNYCLEPTECPKCADTLKVPSSRKSGWKPCSCVKHREPAKLKKECAK